MQKGHNRNAIVALLQDLEIVHVNRCEFSVAQFVVMKGFR